MTLFDAVRGKRSTFTTFDTCSKISSSGDAEQQSMELLVAFTLLQAMPDSSVISECGRE